MSLVVKIRVLKMNLSLFFFFFKLLLMHAKDSNTCSNGCLSIVLANGTIFVNLFDLFRSLSAIVNTNLDNSLPKKCVYKELVSNQSLQFSNSRQTKITKYMQLRGSYDLTYNDLMTFKLRLKCDMF